MQRIKNQDDRIYDIAMLQEQIQLLNKYFPPSIANLFAIPKKFGKHIEWWTELQGRPLAFQSLNISAQQRLLHLIDQRGRAIHDLVIRLQEEGKLEEAQKLQNLLEKPHPENIWSIHDEPLVTSWGGKPPLIAVATPPFTPLPQPKLITSPSTASKRPRWILFLLLPILLFFLTFFYFWNKENTQSTSSFVCKNGVEPPDFVAILDTSGSMQLNLNITQEEEKWFFSKPNHLDKARVLRAFKEPSRITVAKDVFSDVIDNLHPKISTHFLTFDICGKTNYHGLFNANQRDILLKKVKEQSADGGTPIAQSLRHAASLVDGKNKDALILLFVDGEDGCNENACIVAQKLHREKPRMRINVVNISADTMSNCIAEATGGRVYAAEDAVTLSKYLQEATAEIGNATCSAKNN